MDIPSTIIPFIFTLGLIQGLISSILLIYWNIKENRSSLFLGIFLLFFSIDYITPIAESVNITLQYSLLNKIFDFRWIMFSLFYIYVRQVSILPKSKTMYYYLLPWLVMLIINLLAYYKAFSGIEKIFHSVWFSTFFYQGSNAYDIFMVIKTLLFINKHSAETNNQYTSTNLKELKWAKLFVISGFIFVLAMHIRLVVQNFYLDLFETIANVGFLYWVSIYGMRQQNVQSLINETDVTNIPTNDSSNDIDFRGKQVTDEYTELTTKIEQYLLEKKTFLMPDLTIADVSNDIGEHSKRVSLAINTITKKNFKSYINSFRVNEAKHLLKDKSASNFSIEGIGIEVGFKSKSVFYAAFKKETGVTPLTFKTQH